MLRLWIFVIIFTLSYEAGAQPATHTSGPPPGPSCSLVWQQNITNAVGQPFGAVADGTSVFIVGQPGRIERRSNATGVLNWTVNSAAQLLEAVTDDPSAIYVGGLSASGARLIEKRSKANGATIWSRTTNPGQVWGLARSGNSLIAVGNDTNSGAWAFEKLSATTGATFWTVTFDPNPAGTNDTAISVAADSTYFYVAGSDWTPGVPRWVIQKRSIGNGSLVWSQTPAVGAGPAVPHGVGVDANSIYISGYITVSGDRQWLIERRNKVAGTMVWQKFTNLPGDTAGASGLAIDGTSLFIAGYDNQLSPNNTQWRLEKRNTANGALQCNGALNSTPGPDQANAIAVDATGVYLVGLNNGGPVPSLWVVTRWTK